MDKEKSQPKLLCLQPPSPRFPACPIDLRQTKGVTMRNKIAAICPIVANDILSSRQTTKAPDIQQPFSTPAFATEPHSKKR